MGVTIGDALEEMVSGEWMDGNYELQVGALKPSLDFVIPIDVHGQPGFLARFVVREWRTAMSSLCVKFDMEPDKWGPMWMIYSGPTVGVATKPIDNYP